MNQMTSGPARGIHTRIQNELAEMKQDRRRRTGAMLNAAPTHNKTNTLPSWIRTI